MSDQKVQKSLIAPAVMPNPFLIGFAITAAQGRSDTFLIESDQKSDQKAIRPIRKNSIFPAQGRSEKTAKCLIAYRSENPSPLIDRGWGLSVPSVTHQGAGS
jgi:hypothetical protein